MSKKKNIILVVVIAVVCLAVVLGVVVTLFAGAGVYLLSGAIDDAKSQRVEGDLRLLELSLKGYERNNYSTPPTQEQGLLALVERPTVDPQPERWRAYLDQSMKDPWGAEYQYRFPPTKSTKKYDLFSLGEDGVESEDDIGNW